MLEKKEVYKGKQASYHDKRNVVNKAHLIEPIIRHRIQDSLFYKQYLFLTNEATLLPVIVEHVKFIGGLDLNLRPSPFICCLLRLLELEPSEDIIKLYLNQIGYNEFKYLTALVLIYIRLVQPSEVVYTVFDTYFSDSRKLRMQLKSPKFNDNGIPVNYTLSYMDEWVDKLILEERVVDIILPRLIRRSQLVERGLIKNREYSLSEEENSDIESSSDAKSDSEYESDSD